MKMMIWKELRENLKWAALGFLVLSLAEIFALVQGQQSSGSSETDLTLCGSAFLMVSSLGCSAVGVALGALQILPELRRDRWAVLLHRPISRGRILLDKIVGGLLLYFLATAAPLLISIIYVALPGRFAAPFLPGMAWPAISDLFLGMSFYLGALLISLNRGSWFGFRGLLAFALIPIFYLQMVAPNLFVAPFVASLVLTVAAVGSIKTNGSMRARGMWGKAALVSVALVASQTFLILLQMVLSAIPTGERRGFADTINYVLTADGNIAQLKYNEEGFPVETSINGTPVPRIRNPTYFVSLSAGFSDENRLGRSVVNAGPRDLWNYVKWVNWRNEGPENWFLLIQQNYFVGYDKQSGRRVGIVDREGFHPPGAVPKPFEHRVFSAAWSAAPPSLFWSGGKLYGIDFGERTLKPLVNFGSEAIYGSEILEELEMPPRFLAVTLANEIRVLDLKSGAIVKIPYAHDVRIWSVIYLAALPAMDRLFVEYQTNTDQQKPIFVDEVDLKGAVIGSHTLKDRSYLLPSPGIADRFAEFITPPIAAVAFLAPDAFKAKDSGARARMWKDAIAAFVLSAATGFLALVWARRAGFPEKTCRRWAALVALLGVPGLLTFRLTGGFPTRVPCPSCERSRPIEGEMCPACHEAWGAPSASGIEIFDAFGAAGRGTPNGAV